MAPKWRMKRKINNGSAKPVEKLANAGHISNHEMRILKDLGIVSCGFLVCITTQNLLELTGFTQNRADTIVTAARNMLAQNYQQRHHCVLVENLHRDVTEDFLRRLFRPASRRLLFAEIPSQSTVRRNTRFGYVFYRDHESAVQALAMNGWVLKGLTISVRLCVYGPI